MLGIYRASLLTACLVLAACSTTIQTMPHPDIEPQPIATEIELEQLAWWRLRFKLNWPEEESPDLSGHLLLAEQVLLPLLVEHQEELRLWRFHRRAGRDDSGNQFSLIFLADPLTAERINEQVSADAFTVWLQSAGMLERTRFGRDGKGDTARFEETSDRAWPEEIQESWPWFIMGASQAWLMHLQAISNEQGLSDSMDYESLIEHYADVASVMNAQWRDNAQHAYFHHLSAIYGYQPVKLRSAELKQF